MTLRWISLVPPAIDRARLPRKPAGPDGAVALAGDRGRAEQGQALLLHVLLVLDAEQLAHAGLGSGLTAAERPQRGAHAEHGDGVGVDHQAAEPVGDQRRRRAGPGVRARSNSADTPGPNDEPDAIDTRSLASVVRAHAHPSVGPPTRQSSGTNTSTSEISLNMAMPVSSRSGRTSMPGRRHVDEEAADAVVAGRVGIGAGQADGPVGPVGHRRPDLLAGDRPAAVDPGRPRW